MSTALIPLTQGKSAIVDADMFDELNKWKWHFYNGYAFRCENRRAEGKSPLRIPMHRAIAGTLPGMETDHINHDTLDNRRENLRVCTRSENQRNRPANRNNKLGVKGVTVHRSGFVATIGHRRTVIYLGLFKTLELAQEAYAAAAARFHGQFARTR